MVSKLSGQVSFAVRLEEYMNEQEKYDILKKKWIHFKYYYWKIKTLVPASIYFIQWSPCFFHLEQREYHITKAIKTLLGIIEEKREDLFSELQNCQLKILNLWKEMKEVQLVSLYLAW